MRKICLMAAIAVLAVAPLTVAPSVAQAQTAPAPVVPAPVVPAPVLPGPAASGTVFGFPPAQALAVGVGMIAGGVGVGVLTSGPFSTLVGAAAGALIGDWWYATKLAPGVASATPMRHQTSASLAY